MASSGASTGSSRVAFPARAEAPLVRSAVPVRVAAVLYLFSSHVMLCLVVSFILLYLFGAASCLVMSCLAISSSLFSSLLVSCYVASCHVCPEAALLVAATSRDVPRGRRSSFVQTAEKQLAARQRTITSLSSHVSSQQLCPFCRPYPASSSHCLLQSCLRTHVLQLNFTCGLIRSSYKVLCCASSRGGRPVLAAWPKQLPAKERRETFCSAPSCPRSNARSQHFRVSRPRNQAGPLHIERDKASKES